MGAVLGEASPGYRKALIGYARAFGLAYQIADDWLDGEKKCTNNQKETLQNLHYLVSEASGCLSCFGGKAEILEGLLVSLKDSLAALPV
jgi:geranylgeranyl pyrophosphate synthase